jgi:hypothetical protein
MIMPNLPRGKLDLTALNPEAKEDLAKITTTNIEALDLQNIKHAETIIIDASVQSLNFPNLESIGVLGEPKDFRKIDEEGVIEGTCEDITNSTHEQQKKLLED